MTILWEDSQMLLVIKPPGLPCQHPSGDSLERQLIQWRIAVGQPGEIYPVHRLDQMVGGCMVWAKHRHAAAALSKAVAEHTLQKEYLAVVRGRPDLPEGVLEDLLFHDKAKNKTYVVQRERKGVRAARLSYRTLECIKTPDGPLSLLQILLHTGRTHQIRAQFASRAMPLWGDGKYGGGNGRIALWSWRLTIDFADVCISALPPQTMPWQLFSALPVK